MEESRYLKFEDVTFPRKRYRRIRIVEKGRRGLIGDIIYSKEWKQYVFQPGCVSYYSRGCLREIADFISELANQRLEKVFK